MAQDKDENIKWEESPKWLEAEHKVFEIPIIEVVTNKVTTIENFKANLDKNFEDLNNKILEYKNKCPMRKFNENLFREKRGMNRRISHDAEIKK